MRVRLLLPLLIATGCAFDAGEGFAVLEPTVRAAYTSPASREVGDGYQRLSSDFQVRLTTARVRLERIELIGSSGGGGPTAFDPANPPPGYTICHNGHCDREDGAQVSYEDVAAELGGGGASASTVATLPVGSELDLLAPETRTLECTPDCELPQTTVSSARWMVTDVRIEGRVRDTLAVPRFPDERSFRFELAPTGVQFERPVLTGTLDVPSDRENAPRVLLDLTLELTPVSFDAISWTSASPDMNGTLDLNSHPTTRAQMLKAIAELAPKAEVKREDR